MYDIVQVWYGHNNVYNTYSTATVTCCGQLASEVSGDPNEKPPNCRDDLVSTSQGMKNT